MATLTEANSWEAGIYQLELTDPVVGGADGLSNLQAKQLANRTLYLKTLVDALGTGKQPLDATLTALAGVVTAANQLIYATGPDAFSTSALSAFARTLLDDADAATARGTLGAQAADATLTALAGVVTAANQLIYATGADTFATTSLSAFIRTLLDDADAATARTTLGIGSVATLTSDVDGTLATNSDTRVPTQKAVKTYVDGLIAAQDAMVFEGVIDCSENPSYPAADRGHTYRVSVAGKIGGAAGLNVEAGDILICTTDGTASGTHAAVGANWGVIQANLDGALLSTAIGVTVQGYDATLAALASVVTAANQLIYATGPDAFAATSLSAFARTLLDDADAATARATLGAQPLDATLTAMASLATAANQMIYSTGADTFALATLSAFARTLLDDADAATARATLGAQPLDATLTAFAALVTAADGLIYSTGADTFAQTTLSAFARTLLDDADAATARATLEALGTTDFTGSNQQLAANGYQMLAGGLILQWGKAGSLAGAGSVTVTLPISFPNAGLNVQCNRASASTGTTHGAINAVFASASQIIIRNGSSDTMNPMWFALGY